MTTQTDKTDAFVELSIINACLSDSMKSAIGSKKFNHPYQREIDYTVIDRAIAAAERLVAAVGPDTPVPAGGYFRGTSAGQLLVYVRDVAEMAAPYRPVVKEKRA